MNSDAKTHLNQFLQRYCKRPIGKTDIVYTMTTVGGGFQATVKLPCMDADAEFTSEVMASEKDAEKEAAQQALNKYSDLLATVPARNTNKRKSYLIDSNLEGPDANARTEVQFYLQKKLDKTNLVKADCLYKTEFKDGMWTATIEVPCLEPQEFTGEPAADENAAKQSAAKALLEMNKADIEEVNRTLEINGPPESKQSRQRAKASGKWSQPNPMVEMIRMMTAMKGGKGKPQGAYLGKGGTKRLRGDEW